MKGPICFGWGALILAVLLTGCEAMNFSKYEGTAQIWPTGNAFTSGVFDVPVYGGWPEKPYDVLGIVQFGNANVDWNRGDMQLAARKAKEAGGDALIVVPKGKDPSPTMAEARRTLGVADTRTYGIVVKWR